MPFKNKDKEKVVLFKKNGTEIEIKDLQKSDNKLIDKEQDKQFTVTERPVILKNGKKTSNCYIADDDTGATVSVQKDQSLLSLKTTPNLMQNVMDTEILNKAFKLKPERKMLVGMFALGIVAGFFMGIII
jgi:hypothetical protein